MPSPAAWRSPLVRVFGPWVQEVGVGSLRADALAGLLGAVLALHLETAVLAGVLLSLVIYLYRPARPVLRSMGFDRPGPGRSLVVVDARPGEPSPAHGQQECPQLKLLRMEGSVWFGAIAHVDEHLRALRDRAAASADGQRFLLVMAKRMNTIDLAAADLWDKERLRRRALGGDLYFHRPRPQVLATWGRSGFLKRLGEHHVFPGKRSAIAAIVPRLDESVCARRSARIFEECALRPGARRALPF